MTGLSLSVCGPKNLAVPVPELTILCWEEYLPEEVIADFEELSGIRVHLEEYSNADQLRGLLSAEPGQFDVVVTDDYTATELIAERHFAEIDPEMVPNRIHLDPQFLDAPGDPGNRYSIPYLWGTTLIAYNRTIIPDPDRSWKLLWDPKISNLGKVLLVDETNDALCIGSLSAGRSMNDSKPDGVEVAVSRLEELLERKNVGFAGFIPIRDELIAGTCAVGVIYSGDAAVAASKNPDVDYFIPEEGAPQWVDSFLVCRGSKKTMAAFGFINFMLKPEIGARCAEINGGSTPNRAARSRLAGDPVMAEDPELLLKCSYIQPRDYGQATLSRMARLFRELQYASVPED